MSDRLSRLSWLKHGLQTLAENGVGALKAEQMAQALNVSRGSFYWHFKDMSTFKQALLEHWRLQATQHVIGATNAKVSAKLRLGALIRRAFNADNRLERAVRAWAAQNETAATTLKVVDDERIGYLEELLISEGVSPPHAHVRATFLYWAYLGRAMTTTLDADAAPDTNLDDIVAMFSS